MGVVKMSDNDLLQKILNKLEKIDILESDLKEVKSDQEQLAKDIKEIKAYLLR